MNATRMLHDLGQSRWLDNITLTAFADHGEAGQIMAADGGDCETELGRFAKAGVDVDALAAQLQTEGANAFSKSRNELMDFIASKTEALRMAA